MPLAPPVLYVMYNAMRFEWDADKDRSNQKKHAGIDFETASRVFADPGLLLRKDRVIDGEQRWHGAWIPRGEFTWRRRNHPHHLGPRSRSA